MSGRKLLLLGGSDQQIIAIKTAKRLGYQTVLCDYLRDNPGQYHADRFYLESTTDKDAVLKVAKAEGIDGVLAYASDPAAPTAAYVAEKLGLPGNPYESVRILCEKDLFRQFLRKHGFCTPAARGYSSIKDAETDIITGRFKLPVVVKPVDSSGSKGVFRIDAGCVEKTRYFLNKSMSYSRAKRVIVEEWVEKHGYQIAGDGMSIDGKLVFRCFGSDHFNPLCENPYVPVSASFPSDLPENVQEKVHGTIQRLITELGMGTCTYNFDIRIDKDCNVYLMEVAPRAGGNYIPDVVKYATGINLTEYCVRSAMGEKISSPDVIEPEGFWSYYAVHSLQSGILDSIEIKDPFKDKVIENHLIKHSGDHVFSFTEANTSLGCLIMKFSSMHEMHSMMDHSEQWITVHVKN